MIARRRTPIGDRAGHPRAYQLDGAGHEHGREQQRDRARVQALLQPGAEQHAGDGRHADEQGVEHAHVAVQPLHGGGEAGDEHDRRERGGGRGALVVAEPQHQQRHDHAAAADAEQAAEKPASVPIAISVSVAAAAERSAATCTSGRAGHHERHTRPRVPSCNARGGARADPLRSRPLSRAARHRRHARADRPPRGRRARARGHAHAADRDRPALPRGRLRERPPRQPPRARSSRSGRSRMSATTAASCCARGRPAQRSTPSSPTGRARVREFAARAYTGRASSACACAARTRTRSPRSTGAAPPTRRRRRQAVREIARRARAGGLRGPLGAQGARGAPAGRFRQGPRHRRAAARCGGRPRRCTSATTPPTSTRFRGLRSLVESGALAERGVRGGQLRRSASRAGAGGRPDGRRPRRRAGAARGAAVAPCGSSTSSGPPYCSAPARRRRWPRSPCSRPARRSEHPARGGRGRLVADRHGGRPAAGQARRRRIRRSRACCRARGPAPRCPSTTRARSCSTACGRCCCSRCCPAGSRSSRRRSPASPPASRSSGRSPGGARTRRWRRSRSATEPASTCAAPRRCGRWRWCARPASRPPARSARTAPSPEMRPAGRAVQSTC